MAFEVQLQRVPITKVWRMEGSDVNSKAKRLQDLFDRGLAHEYAKAKSELESEGGKFSLSAGRVYQIYDNDDNMQVPIRFQVKDGTITWYFIAPMDATHQEFRDEVYLAAALGHQSVTGHCERYWRGTNSLHIKKMHTREAEANFNHNHYRLEGNLEATPHSVYQHLMGFVKAQNEMGLVVVSEDGTKREKFLDRKEALKICQDFNIYWVKTRHVGDARVMIIGEERIDLPARSESLISEYRRSPLQQLTDEDIQEWEENRHKEEPCRTISADMPTPEKLASLRASTRGIGTELANIRQLAGSKANAVSTIVEKNDKSDSITLTPFIPIVEKDLEFSARPSKPFRQITVL